MKEFLHKPLIIGITGGLASGKSTLARMIAGRGIAHIDADAIVHRLMHHDRDMITAIAAAIPDAVTKGRIDRAKLAAAITADPTRLAALEAIIHPRVRAVEMAAIDAAQRNRLRAVVLDVPLLFETAADELCDVVIVAHAPRPHRRRRAFARTGMTEQKFDRLIARQWPDAARRHLADIVIPTTIGKAATRRKVMCLMREWGLL
jgi:dephospho-CoA kinase